MLLLLVVFGGRVVAVTLLQHVGHHMRLAVARGSKRLRTLRARVRFRAGVQPHVHLRNVNAGVDVNNKELLFCAQQPRCERTGCLCNLGVFVRVFKCLA